MTGGRGRWRDATLIRIAYDNACYRQFPNGTRKVSNAGMMARLLLVICLCCSSSVLAQISGQFRLEKAQYSLGEPIFIDFEAVNNGSAPANFIAENTVTMNRGCSPYSLHVNNRPSDAPRASCKDTGPRGVSFMCGPINVVLQPGEKHVDRILLNLFNEVDKPGTYAVHATRSAFLGWSDGLKEDSTFTITVSQTPVDARELLPLVDQLRSGDGKRISEAARTLAAIAPKSYEDALLSFVDDAYLWSYAPLALHRLNTPRSLAAMRKLAAITDPHSWEHRKALEYLANDPCADDPLR
jgi:hypothetical protein